jgi:uncharacterized protein (TIGR02996 family)
VFDDPADDNTRLVYADALLQRGDDPHAELIVLQIERARGMTSAPRRARERTIIDEYFPRVVGPLAAVVRPTSAKVERGFLASAKLAPEEQQLAGDPWWATVRALDGGHPDLVTHAAMRSLESLVAYTPAHVEAVAKAAPPTLRSLACAFTSHDANPAAWHGALAAVGASVAPLTHVEIRPWEWASWRPMPNDYRALLESARGQQLTSLHAYAPNSQWGYVADRGRDRRVAACVPRLRAAGAARARRRPRRVRVRARQARRARVPLATRRARRSERPARVGGRWCALARA